MEKKQNVFLVGPMGSGKTTIGRILASKLRYDFHDSDQEIEKRTGVNIPLIFEIEGEEGFRKREQDVIEELTRLHPIVLATGGGAILKRENRQCLSARGTVVFLHSSIDELLDRTSKDKNRPLLQNDSPRETLEALMQTREPLYRKVADLTIETGKGRVQGVANKILEQMGVDSQA